MPLTEAHLRYLLAIYEVSQTHLDISSRSIAEKLGVTKPSVVRIMNLLMERGMIVKEHYGKIYMTDRGIFVAKEVRAQLERVLQNFPPVNIELTEEERFAAALALTGCAARRGGEDTGKLQVVCTLFPYYDFVRAIGGDRVEPYLLVTAGREAHSFEPTPLDVIRISQADVFICNGGESETWVDDILDAAGESIGSVVHMMDHAHVLGEEFSEGMQGGHDHDEHAHDEHDGHDHDGHEEEIEYDEHIWTSPRIAMDLCRVIADTLAQADPAHAQEYQDRLAAYLRELTDLDRAFRDTVEAGQRHLLVFGDRFPLLYFCREYGLDYRAAFHGCSGDTEPSLATLKYLIDKVNQEDIPVVYTIELSSQKVANAIAETTGARVLTFHSCQTLTRQEFDGGETYLSLMWKNVDVLKEGLA